jgi:hypothetical protein
MWELGRLWKIAAALTVNVARIQSTDRPNAGLMLLSNMLCWDRKHFILFSFSTLKPTWSTFYSDYYDLRASTCFEYYLLIPMSCCTVALGILRACSVSWRERDHWGDPGIGGRIILWWIFREVGCGGMDWIGLAQDRDMWQVIVSAVMNLRVQ